ncbi:hypothetical protein C3920_04985 [Novacetimonas pomaceti]|uniref:Lipoprotein n=1 Tax=Novacetimonas pomaceti TaxID=2021998 RepID=A0A318Q8V8_9PROT|nr:hypothetical protein C3920_04985 [Novacetimonas pomaceti]PYD75315.1 hypothetical protein CFR71_09975 [Novacetimonas pomaceti]
MKLWITATVIALSLASCSHRHPRERQETPACVNYHAMMTAPMPPDAIRKLQEQCEKSQPHS